LNYIWFLQFIEKASLTPSFAKHTEEVSEETRERDTVKKNEEIILQCGEIWEGSGKGHYKQYEEMRQYLAKYG